MSPHLRYLRYVARHKTFVLVAGLRTGAPLWRLIVHDASKFSRAEWGPYVRRFFAGRAGTQVSATDPDEFHRAWTHHWHRNHWEHWLRIDGGTLRPIVMPERFVREMVADWMGAGRAITGRWEVAEWYGRNRAAIVLADETRALAESLMRLCPADERQGR